MQDYKHIAAGTFAAKNARTADTLTFRAYILTSLLVLATFAAIGYSLRFPY